MSVLTLYVTRDGERPPGVVSPRPTGDTFDDEEQDEEFASERELVIVVDGVAELDSWDGLGMNPDDLLRPDHPLLPPADGSSVERVVQRCGCGDVGCGSVTASIRRAGDQIKWSLDTGEAVQLGPFSFDAGQYEAEVRRAHDERPWETARERVARLASEELADLRDATPWSFDWAVGTWGAGDVVVSLTEKRPHPRAGQATTSVEKPDGSSWHAYAPAIEATQHIGVFDIDNRSEDEVVRQIVASVRTRDVANWRSPPY